MPVLWLRWKKHQDLALKKAMYDLENQKDNPDFCLLYSDDVSSARLVTDAQMDVADFSKSENIKSESSSHQNEEPTHQKKSIQSEQSQNFSDCIVLYVFAKDVHFFTGSAILSFAHINELGYGERQIFHKKSPYKVIEFSLVSAIEPGHFLLEELDGFKTRGIALYMTLPLPSTARNAEVIFDDMLRVARLFAERYGGVVQDDQKCDLTAQTIEHYRSRIRAVSANIYCSQYAEVD